MKVLVVGINARHIACSAARAGHEIFAVDGYCDLDLKSCASQTALLDTTRAEKIICKCIKSFCPDVLVLGPGMEELSVSGVRILNNPPEKVVKVSDKLWLARWLEDRDYPTIPTGEDASCISFPAVVKPRKGAGGLGCRLVRSEIELKIHEGHIIQEFVEGIPSSVSVIGNGQESKAISVNEQLIGLRWAGAEDFRYCGNITPLQYPCAELAELAERIISELRLVGSNGVDFLITEKGPLVVEVNPRFQGSLETVEFSTGLNVFQSHLEAFQGKLPEQPHSKNTAGRVIIYADKDMKIRRILGLEWATDIPRPGTKIGKGNPLISILAVGKNRQEVMKLLKNRTRFIRKFTQ
jgi:predicted ATP-grasp superfamily ATP-dependent carboligase